MKCNVSVTIYSTILICGKKHVFSLDSLWPHKTLICACLSIWLLGEIFGNVWIQDTVSGWVFFLGNVCVLKGKGVGVKTMRRAVVKFP